MAARRRRNSKKNQALSGHQLALISIVTVLFSSFGTFMALDSGLVTITGAQTLDNGTVTLTVTGVAGCALHNVDGTANTSVVFSATPDQTVATTTGDATGGTIIINNTGNIQINVSANSTNTSTGGFFSGTSVSSDYQVAAGNLCNVNGDESVGITLTYSDVTTDHRSLVRNFGFTNGNNSCDIDFRIHVPSDEPVGTKLDRVYLNCTSGGAGGAGGGGGGE